MLCHSMLLSPQVSIPERLDVRLINLLSFSVVAVAYIVSRLTTAAPTPPRAFETTTASPASGPAAAGSPERAQAAQAPDGLLAAVARRLNDRTPLSTLSVALQTQRGSCPWETGCTRFR
jgi:hypothetical protein